jgi:hypothetical protein
MMPFVGANLKFNLDCRVIIAGDSVTPAGDALEKGKEK